MSSRLTFGDLTHVMAVINLSPESRNPQSVALDVDQARAMASRYAELGATVIDLGGQSSHYENPTISDQLELKRLIPAVEAIAKDGLVVSVDTWKPAVAAAALDAGASIINDTGGLTNPKMVRVVAEAEAAAVVVYVEGAHPHDVGEIDTGADKARRSARVLEARLADLTAAGVKNLIVDPGIALNYRGDYEAYTRLQLEVIRESRHLHRLGYPVLIPIPRKKELARVLALITLSVEYQADLIRVHDVAEACEIVRYLGRLP